MNILILCDIFKLKSCIYIHKLNKFEYLYNYINEYQIDPLLYNFRNDNIRPPPYTLSRSRQALVYQGIKFYNSLENNIKLSSTSVIFKNKLKKLFIANY